MGLKVRDDTTRSVKLTGTTLVNSNLKDYKTAGENSPAVCGLTVSIAAPVWLQVDQAVQVKHLHLQSLGDSPQRLTAAL